MAGTRKGQLCGDDTFHLKSQGSDLQPGRLVADSAGALCLLRPVKFNHSRGGPLPGKGRLGFVLSWD